LTKKDVKERVFRLDTLGDKRKRAWSPLSADRFRRVKPGDILMVACDLGGYDPERGFDAAVTRKVDGVKTAIGPSSGDDGQKFDGDAGSQKPKAIGLEDHLVHVRDAASRICDDLGITDPFRAAVIRAAAWHDVGKAHEQFQLRAVYDDAEPARPLAKAKDWRRIWPKEEGPPARPFFRHELASALAFLAQHDCTDGADLVAFLIAAHHGKVRMGLRSLPGEKAPDGAGGLFARGVWHGDELPEVRAGDEVSATTSLSLDLMRMGDSADGRPSWGARTLRLLSDHGPFKLAFLEAVVRLADWRASEDEQRDGAS
jgi:CRISPR-associated endonuclease/helicase Cas3